MVRVGPNNGVWSTSCSEYCLNGAGVVGVYRIAVTPSARGKGTGAAITLKPVLHARDQDGDDHAVLFSTEMGAPVYSRIGFRMTDVRIKRYLWRNQ